jgi:glycerophosphoryl diester phosphodiesterase
MFRQIIHVGFLFLLSIVAQGQQRAEELRRTFLDSRSNEVLVASHRATHDVFPENSLDAIKSSIALGVDIIEIDVKVSKDGVPFLMHDRTMDRTTTGKGDPEEFTWAELQELFIVDKGKRTSYKIPSLEDALELAYGEILVDLDLKTDRIEKIIEVVKKTEMSEFVFFFESDYEVLQRIQLTNEDLMLMPRAHSTPQADSAIALFDPPVVHIDFSFYTPACVRLIKDSNARVWINALGEPDKEIRDGAPKRALKKLLSNGANVIQTDEPALLIKALKKYGYRSHPAALATK